jgi:CheY-like chemotaxis protein
LIAFQKVINGNFDIVIMDINMPVMDGFQSTRKIKDYFDCSKDDFFLANLNQERIKKK